MKTAVRAFAFSLAACAAGAAQAEGELFIYNWSDYTAPELVEKFQKDTGIKVTVDSYDSNETLLAKLKSGSAGYDIIVVSSDFVEIFAKEGLIAEIDAPTLAGFPNLDKRWTGPVWDPDNAYTVPWNWGTTSYSVNTDKVKEGTDSLKLLFEPPAEIAGQVGMFGSPSEVIALAQRYLDMDPCQTDTENMKKVQDLLLAQAPAIKVYNSDGIIERQASGETLVHQQWNGAAMRSRELNPAIKYVYPKEGVVGWMDNVAVPASAKNMNNALEFISYIMQPENMALQSNFTKYANAVTGSEAFFEASMQGAPELITPEDVKVVFTPACSEEATQLMDRVWTRLKR
ncbi:extracellular solute-binding protein [Methylobrevis albus]|uniref:Putrescine-binding periplasmic protein n=1 Tax=Methylobrevis albus TaxID=2793297 RepID=A0A931HYY7_9HYPH|nr:extracellular solute-binding protein [Methylobrevis albus]MBH0236223.1 extracellular solute-binding protein [Methylobrevis albus]